MQSRLEVFSVWPHNALGKNEVTIRAPLCDTLHNDKPPPRFFIKSESLEWSDGDARCCCSDDCAADVNHLQQWKVVGAHVSEDEEWVQVQRVESRAAVATNCLQ